ncbi:Ni/Fe-hydrogenase, b-type cytochrome subunit [Methylovulum psychrotolerans]|uniref:Ni/Fe-hydrogenase, b-type cytochrome subunit n=1 Tax=Methylovulum psychrotolerans TaxID=1704499 RepID=A0A2S5CKK5_9GAMM|nr:Ni/Fe-hydrogenase, b-type cytochrome subunit [Methylovulum psychrotolerans]POZ51349.1 Ni/Fe-hydrogenase, b-type cytochrome subunit [Methylovulum psychrotolerans]
MTEPTVNTPLPAVYVYEKPIRLWHGLNALLILTLILTGYFIAAPLASVGGEASEHFLMGYIRFGHFAAGYLLAIGLLFRLYWAYAGNGYAKEIFQPPLLSKVFWQGVGHEILWYAFLAKEPRKYAGHNPLALLAMHFAFVWGSLFMVITGFALYGEGTGQGSWQYSLFSSWVLPLFGGSQSVHSWHHLVMWLIVCFVLIHIYVAVREDKVSRQSLLSTMVTGWRTFKDDKPLDDVH